METKPTITRAPVSASKIGQCSLCPGNVWAQKGLPDLPDEEWSEEGTLLHWHDANPKESREKLHISQIEALQRNAGLRDTFIEKEKVRLGIAPDAECVTIIEREYILLDDNMEPVISHGSVVPGHPDRILYFPQYKVAIIFDSKFGRKIVTAAWLNQQLKFYAIVFSDEMDCETIIVAITQPWVASPNDFHSAEYSSRDISAMRDDLLRIIRATEPENAPRHASIEACRYCAAAGAGCPMAVSVVTEVAVTKLNDLTPQQLEELGPEMELAAIVIDSWDKRMKYWAAKAPGLLSKYALSPPGQARSIADGLKALEALFEAKMLAKDSGKAYAADCRSLYLAAQSEPDRLLAAMEGFLAGCRPSVGDIEDVVAKTQNISKRAAGTRLAAVLGPLIVLTPSEGSLIKKTDNIHQE